MSNKLQNTFVQNVNSKRMKNFATIYAASPSGLTMFHPGFKDVEICQSAYDPRVRPWFSTGSTGILNIIIFLLIKDNQKLDKAKELGEYFNNILKANDWAMTADLNNCPQTV